MTRLEYIFCLKLKQFADDVIQFFGKSALDYQFGGRSHIDSVVSQCH